MASATSDLVLDTKIHVELRSGYTHRFSIRSENAPGKYVRRQHREDIWRQENILGTGSYGSVWLERCLTSPDAAELQAVKTIAKAMIVRDGINYHEELEAIAKFSQKKYDGLFVRFIGWYESDAAVFIAMEHIQYGDLDSHLKAPLPEGQVQEITVQVCEGLEALHSNGFVHRDLKPANIFVVQKGPDWWIKIGDFGFSKRYDGNLGLQSLVGTMLFLAPEIRGLNNGKQPRTQRRYTEKVDIWALGITAFYMKFHSYPFNSLDELSAYAEGPRSNIFPNQAVLGSTDFDRFIMDVLSSDPAKRISAIEALQHTWLRNRSSRLASDISKMSFKGDSGRSLLLSEGDFKSWNSTEQSTQLSMETSTLPSLDKHWQGNPATALSTLKEKEQVMPKESVQHKSSSSISPRGRRENFFSKISHPRRSQKNIFRPNEQLVAGVTQEKESVLADLHALFESGKYFADKGEHSKALANLQKAADGRGQLLGSRDPKTLEVLFWVGRIHLSMKDYDKGFDILKDVLEIFNTSLDEFDEERLSCLFWIGNGYNSQARDLGEQQPSRERDHQIKWSNTKAARYLQEAADGYAARGARDPNVQIVLGIALHSLERYYEAQEVMESTLQIIDAEDGPYHERTFGAIYRLALTHAYQRNYEDVHRLMDDLISKKEFLYGKNHAKTIESLSDLEWMMTLCGKADEASFFKKEIDNRKRGLGS
ncbi:hypothetical protein N7462_000105 [Penicillium macrosclerotiorum]|uniref:uncharacterized protein n=1 Tax=Penicillium macrosclerotiorum TaxID=303699 RepID=UPI002546DD31|nr:uncharacterized protein N7462_000105 [Penicillium macrosclerotiorum]KAJ5698100.1 hypothetical protein N7462_000105 [Penicillium macrosclerotiorum]